MAPGGTGWHWVALGGDTWWHPVALGGTGWHWVALDSYQAQIAAFVAVASLAFPDASPGAAPGPAGGHRASSCLAGMAGPWEGLGACQAPHAEGGCLAEPPGALGVRLGTAAALREGRCWRGLAGPGCLFQVPGLEG